MNSATGDGDPVPFNWKKFLKSLLSQVHIGPSLELYGMSIICIKNIGK